MCILIALLNSHPQFPAIFIHIREEDPSRPTSQFGVQPPSLVCAVDQRAGGTAAAFNPATRRIAFINNLHEPSTQGDTVSRGLVTLEALNTTSDAVSLAENSRVNPFQLVTGSVSTGEYDLVVHGATGTSVDRLTGVNVLDNQRGGGIRSREVTEVVYHANFDIGGILQGVESIMLRPTPGRIISAKAQTVLTVDHVGSVCMRHRDIYWASETPTFSDWVSVST